MLKNWLNFAERSDRVGSEDENIRFAGTNIVTIDFCGASLLLDEEVFQLYDSIKIAERAAAELEHEFIAHTRPMRPNGTT